MIMNGAFPFDFFLTTRSSCHTTHLLFLPLALSCSAFPNFERNSWVVVDIDVSAFCGALVVVGRSVAIHDDEEGVSKPGIDLQVSMIDSYSGVVNLTSSKGVRAGDWILFDAILN